MTTLLFFIIGLFLGILLGVYCVTTHLVDNNRITETEARWYYSVKNLWNIYYASIKR